MKSNQLFIYKFIKLINQYLNIYESLLSGKYLSHSNSYQLYPIEIQVFLNTFKSKPEFSISASSFWSISLLRKKISFDKTLNLNSFTIFYEEQFIQDDQIICDTPIFTEHKVIYKIIHSKI
jgi:hypothetical protein